MISRTRRCLISLFLISLFFLPAAARAELLQIIHTNDLHSHLDHATDPARGGYARVKTVIDRLKDAARAQGIDTLTLDAGDFMEGSQFYLSEKGANVFRAMDRMGYDAVSIGNHDWLMGPGDMDEILAKVPPSFRFLGANFAAPGKYSNIARYVEPYAEFSRSGYRVAVLGLTTSSVLYSWRLKDGVIFNPVWEASYRLPELRKRNDFVIALTHIGVKKDKLLAAQTEGLDLVVGGHSHTKIPEAIYVPNPRGKRIPIVQTGQHGDFVGDLLVDLSPSGLRIVHYRLVPVTDRYEEDPEISAFVAQTRESFYREYGKEWLTTPVGYSDVPLDRPVKKRTVWGNIVTQTMIEAAGADAAFDVAAFSGVPQKPGPLTPETLFVLYPRMFDFSDHYGWTVWQNKVWGFWLSVALKAAIGNGAFLSTGGITYDLVPKKGGKYKVKNIKIAGKKLRWLKRYKIAFPEGITRGADAISKTLRLILKKPRDTGKSMWLELERKVKQIGVIREEDWLPYPKG